MPYTDKLGRLCGFLNFEETPRSEHLVRRYFLLDKRKQVLEYYADHPLNLPQGGAAVGYFPLNHISYVNRPPKLKLVFCFSITVAGEPHLLQADNEPDCSEWCKAVSDASKTQPTPAARPSPARPNSIAVAPKEHARSRSEPWLGRANSMYRPGQEPPRLTPAANVAPLALPPTRIPPLAVANNHNSSTLERESAAPRVVDGARVVHAGYCHRHGGVPKAWRRRYVALTETSLIMLASHKDKVPDKSIPLQEMVEARPSVGVYPDRENIFEVVTPSRILYLQSGSASERVAWISQITEQLNRLKPKHKEVSVQTGDDDGCAPDVVKDSYSVWV